MRSDPTSRHPAPFHFFDSDRLDNGDNSDAFLWPMPDKAMHEPQFRPSHSRGSSTGSLASSPHVSIFSSRSHNRWPSSTSSLATSPDSPAMLAKSALGDLVEEPAERDDELDLAAEAELYTQVQTLEDFCLCDSIFCEHQQMTSSPTTAHDSSFASSEFFLGANEDRVVPSTFRRGSDENSKKNLSTRLSKHFYSIERQWRSRKPRQSVSSLTGTRSAPPSRSSSVRRLRRKQPSMPSLVQARPDDSVETRQSTGPDEYNFDAESDVIDHASFSEWIRASTQAQPRSPTASLASPTPARRSDPPSESYVPFQSPRTTQVAIAEATFTSAVSSPSSPTAWTRSLSTKPSNLSSRPSSSAMAADVPPLAVADDLDIWAIKLGHANFHIDPAPYIPEFCTVESFRQLHDDWEKAHLAFLRHLHQIVEHHGQTSKTYALTREKWESIDAQWRANIHSVRAALEANGCSPSLYLLPETLPCLNIPTLSDPSNPEKFPTVDPKDIVGPMVRYAAPEPVLPKKPTFLKLLTDATSLLRKS